MNQIDLPLFLRQFTCKKTIQKIKLADIPYNNNSFNYAQHFTNCPNPKSIQNRSAYAEIQRKSTNLNEPSLEIKVNLDSSPDSPKKPETPGRPAVPDEPISEPPELSEQMANEKSNSEQGLVFCFLFQEHVLRFFKNFGKIFHSDNSMGSEIENQILIEEQEKRKFLKYIGTIKISKIFTLETVPLRPIP